jgi:hypothetical protein
VLSKFFCPFSGSLFRVIRVIRGQKISLIFNSRLPNDAKNQETNRRKPAAEIFRFDKN